VRLWIMNLKGFFRWAGRQAHQEEPEHLPRHEAFFKGVVEGGKEGELFRLWLGTEFLAFNSYETVGSQFYEFGKGIGPDGTWEYDLANPPVGIFRFLDKMRYPKSSSMTYFAILDWLLGYVDAMEKHYRAKLADKQVQVIWGVQQELKAMRMKFPELAIIWNEAKYPEILAEINELNTYWFNVRSIYRMMHAEVFPKMPLLVLLPNIYQPLHEVPVWFGYDGAPLGHAKVYAATWIRIYEDLLNKVSEFHWTYTPESFVEYLGYMNMYLQVVAAILYTFKTYPTLPVAHIATACVLKEMGLKKRKHLCIPPVRLAVARQLPRIGTPMQIQELVSNPESCVAQQAKDIRPGNHLRYLLQQDDIVRTSSKVARFLEHCNITVEDVAVAAPTVAEPNQDL
jgi:hypothetical protein